MDKFYSSIKNFQQNDVFMCMYPGKKLPGFFSRLSREESSLTNMTACRHYLQGEDSASNANEEIDRFPSLHIRGIGNELESNLEVVYGIYSEH
jgi:hypothetical protein